jgi:KaiC/GvpD/RAD55 family RecA-like ATPase
MGLLQKAGKRRHELLSKLSKKGKKYIDHVSKQRKKAIHQEIKKQRAKISKALSEPAKGAKKGRKKSKGLTKEPKLKKISKVKSKLAAKPVSTPVLSKVLGSSKVKAVISKFKSPAQKPVEPLTELKTKLHPAAKKKSQTSMDISSIKSQIQSQLQRPRRKSNRKYIYTGVPGFDDLLYDGIPEDAAILVAGGAGSGKTIFSLQTLYNHLKKGKKCIYMSFEESAEHLIEHMEEFGWDVKKYIKSGKFLVKRFNPFDITRSVDALLMQARGELLIDVKPVIFPPRFNPDFIVVDSLTAIASAFTGKEESYRIYIEQLFRFFENIKATAFLITETEQVPKIFSTTGVEEFLADGVIVIYNIKRGNIRERALEILKLRGASHQSKIVAMSIGSDGVVVYPEQEVFGGVDNQRVM